MLVYITVLYHILICNLYGLLYLILVVLGIQDKLYVRPFVKVGYFLDVHLKVRDIMAGVVLDHTLI